MGELRRAWSDPLREMLLDKSEKHKATSDGEDLLTPMVQKAAEAIVSALSATQH